MKIKFKATLIILALMFLTSLILAKREEVNKVKEAPVKDSISQVVSVKETIQVSKQSTKNRYIHQSVKPTVQPIDLAYEGLNAELPLPELMQQVGFKLNTESNIDYSNPELN